MTMHEYARALLALADQIDAAIEAQPQRVAGGDHYKLQGRDPEGQFSHIGGGGIAKKLAKAMNAFDEAASQYGQPATKQAREAVKDARDRLAGGMSLKAAGEWLEDYSKRLHERWRSKLPIDTDAPMSTEELRKVVRADIDLLDHMGRDLRQRAEREMREADWGSRGSTTTTDPVQALARGYGLTPPGTVHVRSAASLLAALGGRARAGRAGADDDDLEDAQDVRMLLDVFEKITGRKTAIRAHARFDPGQDRWPKGSPMGGQWRPTIAGMVDRLGDWLSGDRKGDPFGASGVFGKKISDASLMKVAKERGVTFPAGGLPDRELLVKTLVADLEGRELKATNEAGEKITADHASRRTVAILATGRKVTVSPGEVGPLMDAIRQLNIEGKPFNPGRHGPGFGVYRDDKAGKRLHGTVSHTGTIDWDDGTREKVDEVTGDVRMKQPAFNFNRVQVTGKGNEKMFRRHLRDRPRDTMPQLPTGHGDDDKTSDGKYMADFENFLKAQGVAFKYGKMDPRELVASQSQLNGHKVAKIHKFMAKGWKPGGVMIVARDGEGGWAVVDGHHRWAAAAAESVTSPMDVEVMAIDEHIDKILGSQEDPTDGLVMKFASFEGLDVDRHAAKQAARSVRHGTHNQESHGNWADGGSGRFVSKDRPASKANSVLGRMLADEEVHVLGAAEAGKLIRWNDPPYYARLFVDQPFGQRPVGAGADAVEPKNIVSRHWGDALWRDGLLESAESGGGFPISERIRLSAKGRDVLDAHRKP